MNALAEAKRILAAPAAHMILSNPEWRKLVGELVAIIEAADAPRESVMCGACGGLLHPDCGHRKNAIAASEPVPCRPAWTIPAHSPLVRAGAGDGK